MQIKSTLNTAILTSLLGMSSLTWAADQTENTHVNVKVQDNEGKVFIVKGVNGNEETIEDSFVITDDMDVDAKVKEILESHGIDQDKNGEIHKITKKMNHHGKNMVWVQKSNDVDLHLDNGQATVIIKTNDNGEEQIVERIIDVDADTDIDALIDQLMDEHGIEAGDAEVHRKVIKIDKQFSNIAKIANDKPRMGFMANVQDNGWKIISVVSDSGAAEAGMKKGDVIISIDGQSTGLDGLGLTEFIAIDKLEGDSSEVKVLRDGQQITLNVVAKVIDSPDVIMEMGNGNKWITSSGNDFKFSSGDLDDMFEGLNVDVEHLGQMVEGFGDQNIRVVTTGDADAYFFSDSKMNQWLGKNHHFSTVTESLGKYFGTKKGVLVLEVDQDNKLGLKDGDVIQAINGKDVSSPKDVVKIMAGFKSDESFEIEIIREKETIYLES